MSIVIVENIKDLFRNRIATQDYVQKEIAKLGLKMERIELLMDAYDTSLEDIFEMIKPIQDEIKRIDNMELKMRRIHEEFIRKEKEKKQQKRPYREPNTTEQPKKPQGPIIDDDKEPEKDYTEEIKQLINKNKTRNTVSDPQKSYIKSIIKQYKTALYQGSYEDAIYANVFLDIWAPVINKIRKPQQAFEMQIALNNMYRNNNGMRGEC
jgi:hypothetical protein